MSINANAKAKPKRKRPIRLAEIDANRLYPLPVFLQRLGICRNTLTALRRRGLPVHPIDGRKLLIDGREVIEFFRREWGAK